MEDLSEKKFPVDAKDYKLCEEVGDGVSATVYKALCIPLKKLVAVKVLDLEKCNNGLDGIRREVQTMSLIDHPNVLRAHCSFTTGHKLWVVMPYMAGGSCLHIMKSAYPDGFEEPVIAFLLHEVLKALVYLHSHGHIHRDVKAGNILIDDDGAVKLADFGVSTCMFDTGDRQRSRNTFVGTPCWMAPEVMQQLHGYDFKADIWSLGITALELAHGHAPFSKYPPMKVLLMTLQNAPPGLDYERDKRFSKSFKQMIATCLVKDPQKRPTSQKLLRHQFFKHARSRDYLDPTVLVGLAPLGDRYRMLKAKDAELFVQNKSLYENKDQLSQREYIRGISAWNFNLEDLKSQAALIEDDNMPNVEEAAVTKKEGATNNDAGLQAEGLSTSELNHSKEITTEVKEIEDDNMPNVEEAAVTKKEGATNNDAGLQAEGLSTSELNHSKEITTEVKEDGVNDFDDMKSSLALFPSKPLQALKGCFDIVEDDTNETSPRGICEENGKFGDGSSGQRSFFQNNVVTEHKKHLSSSPLPDNVLSSKTFTVDSDRGYLQRQYYSKRNLSGPMFYRTHRSTSKLSSVDDGTEGAVIQCKGRFKVTSADLRPKTNCVVTPICGGSSNSTNLNLTASSILPSLQSILQQNIVQKEEIVKLTKYVEQTPGKHSESAELGQVDPLQVSPETIRERELQSQIYQLQESLGNLLEELQLQKWKNAQLERQLNSNVNKGTRKEEIEQL